MRRSLLLAGLCLALASSVGAQELTASHLQASADLLEQMDMESLMTQSIDVAMDAQIQGNPQLAPFEDVMREFMADAMGWESIGDDLVRMYAEAFTEDELRALSAFYETELGEKTLRRMPVLMQQGMELGQRVVMERQPELERRIQRRVRELEKRQ